MSAWVLIVIVFGQGSVGFWVPFADEAACLAARQLLDRSDPRIRAVCAQTGRPPERPQPFDLEDWDLIETPPPNFEVPCDAARCGAAQP